MLSGIYIHIPFCIQRCHYCDFYSTTQLDFIDNFVEACVKEIKHRSLDFSSQEFDTIYFGGGTPSVLKASHIGKILTALFRFFSINDQAEITLEVNPDDIDKTVLKEWKKEGVNRLSIGIQSFRDSDLTLMHRRHTASEAKSAVEMGYEAGFTNISADLIYGLPNLKMTDWEHNLSIMSSLPIVHLSAYHLTIERDTVFNAWVKSKKIQMIEEDESFQQYRLLCSYCKENGYEHYEISNFAKKGLYSRHNTKYWQGNTYVGFGPSAHSFDGYKREWNPPSLKSYIDSMQQNNFRRESEIIDQKTMRNELIMTGLRTKWGINRTRFNAINDQPWEEFVLQCSKYIESGDLVIESDTISLRSSSWFKADGIIADLFIV